ncbi:MAG: ankyrin repeat domain-containing protein, partial [Psychromonas sp.]|nr:ankyrin repeat domain-containing protein [Psychromonas sp.]
MDIELVKKALKLIRENDYITLNILFNEHPELLKYEFAGDENWLHKAATSDSPDVLRGLVNHFDIESTERFGRTPLSKALIVEKVEAVKTLIKLGANVNHGKQSSPLSCAVYSKNRELLKLLIDNGANNERTDELINYGLGQGYTDIAQDLAELNYQPAQQDNFKDKLVAQYGELEHVTLTGKSYQLYARKDNTSFTVLSESINANADVIFDLGGFREESIEQVFAEHTPWLLDWFYVLSQVEIDPTQRFIVIERDSESTPYQGILLLIDQQVEYNGTARNIYRLMPLYASEIAFERAQGMESLIHKLDEKRLNPVIV